MFLSLFFTWQHGSLPGIQVGLNSMLAKLVNTDTQIRPGWSHGCPASAACSFYEEYKLNSGAFRITRHNLV
jgi:hypothetical protein